MRLVEIVLAVGVAFSFAGCAQQAASFGSNTTKIPPRPADARYPRWEHYCATVEGPGDPRQMAAKLLGDAGAQGWELVLIDFERRHFCFKRPIEDPAFTAAVDAALAAASTAAPADEDPELAKRRALLDSGIKKTAEGRYEVARALVDQLKSDDSLARGARMVPSMVEGKAQGFKLYAIRPSSIYARLGFANGDALVEVNGFALDTPERAMQVFEKLREAKYFEVVVVRRGERITLMYKVRDP